jgi:hypothetical protein
MKVQLKHFYICCRVLNNFNMHAFSGAVFNLPPSVLGLHGAEHYQPLDIALINAG